MDCHLFETDGVVFKIVLDSKTKTIINNYNQGKLVQIYVTYCTMPIIFCEKKIS